MNLTNISAALFIIALAAVPQLVIYLVTRNDNSYVEPEYEHDYR